MIYLLHLYINWMLLTHQLYPTILQKTDGSCLMATLYDFVIALIRFLIWDVVFFIDSGIQILIIEFINLIGSVYHNCFYDKQRNYD